MTTYDDLIAQARARARGLSAVRVGVLPGGEEVQLSVRLPASLRTSVAAVAAQRGQSVSGFVNELLERAVREESDPFAGLGADLAAHCRSVLAAAVESGAYRRAAEALDEDERPSTTS
jgi:hypothetical protein